MPTYYLAEHPHSGHGLFTNEADARTWCDRQTDYHTPEVTIRWVDGPGWAAQRQPDGSPFEGAAEVCGLELDRLLPQASLPDWD